MPTPAIVRLDGVARHYAWGSSTAIPGLLGVEPDGRPWAELWFGAHPDNPARLPTDDTALDAVIAADPEANLGAEVVARFGPRLPFLLKILTASQALSIQVHPALRQARAGFAAEHAAGVDRDAPNRNYRDDNHKPELICALTEFEAVCGFRDPAETVRMLDALAMPELAELRTRLTGREGLRAAFTYLLTLNDPKPVVAALSSAHFPEQWSGTARAIELAAGDFPCDVGVALTALLNYVRLVPGESLFLGAGNVHAYLRGLGMEIMASSDNVLRCGLTPKHIDVPELLRITDFTAIDDPRFTGNRDAFGTDFAVPVPDFRLLQINLDAHEGSRAIGLRGPMIVLSVSGDAAVATEGNIVALAPGQAAFVAARHGSLTVSGSGVVFVATEGHSGSLQGQERGYAGDVAVSCVLDAGVS
jgi:mannose-6-phosphate isomerase